ncbi:MAG: bifunctional hydroxymethylpyrimidine kinase/phosphomethylpyrimidine kinase [Oceanococcus sp.]
MLLRNKTILCIGGFDPSACAGILADARMLQFLGARSAALITCNTEQNRLKFTGREVVSTARLRRQWQMLIQQTQIDGIKIGALCDLAQADWLASVLQSLTVPIVFDPVFNSSSGGTLGQENAARQIIAAATLSTPNHNEMIRLYGQQWAEQAHPSHPLLITGTDVASDVHQDIKHQLVGTTRPQTWTVPRRRGQFRGTGCLLASAITAHLVAGSNLNTACSQALHNVDQFLAHAQIFPDGVHLPQPPT